MTTLRELKRLPRKDAIGKELAVQRAVWNWALYDDYIKTREVARKHGETAAREYIDKAEKRFRRVYNFFMETAEEIDREREERNEEALFSYKDKEGKKVDTVELEFNSKIRAWPDKLSMERSAYTAVATSVSEVPTATEEDYWDYSDELRQAILEDTINCIKAEENGEAERFAKPDKLGKLTLEALTTLPSVCVQDKNEVQLAALAYDALPADREADTAFPELAQRWKKVDDDAKSVKASSTRVAALIGMFLLALIPVVCGVAVSYFDIEQAAFVLLVTAVFFLIFVIGGLNVRSFAAGFAAVAVLLTLNTVFPYVKYVPEILCGFGGLWALFGVYSFAVTPNKKKAAVLAAQIEPELLALRRSYGQRMSYLFRYLFLTKENNKKATVALENMIVSVAKRLKAVEEALLCCPGYTRENIKPRDVAEDILRESGFDGLYQDCLPQDCLPQDYLPQEVTPQAT